MLHVCCRPENSEDMTMKRIAGGVIGAIMVLMLLWLFRFMRKNPQQFK